jgi:hypothetical protein
MSETSASERPAANFALRTTPLVHPAELVERAEIDTQLHTARNVGQALALSSAFGKIRRRSDFNLRRDA